MGKGWGWDGKANERSESGTQIQIRNQVVSGMQLINQRQPLGRNISKHLEDR